MRESGFDNQKSETHRRSNRRSRGVGDGRRSSVSRERELLDTDSCAAINGTMRAIAPKTTFEVTRLS
jgi:hypothetical protein